jgi:hypothetical protein
MNLESIPVREEIQKNAVSAMAKKLDDTLKGVFDSCWPEGWTMDDVKRRCTRTRVHGSPVEIFYIDGVPKLELHPVELETVRTDMGWTMRLTQNYRLL